MRGFCTNMEYFELFDINGTPIGRTKERNAVHRDGDLHGGAHVWILGDRHADGSVDVLFQKRSENKDSFPGCYDISSAGHVSAGETFPLAAVRELKEELNINAAESDLFFLHRQLVDDSHIFHGKRFVNKEVNFVYALSGSVPLDSIKIQESEISSLRWENSNDTLKRLREGDPSYCVMLSEFEKLLTLTEGRDFLLHKNARKVWH